MKKIRNFITNHSLFIVAVTLIFLVPMIYFFINTKINYDILVYLPEDIETIQGQNILTNEFEIGSYAFVMVDDKSNADILELESKYRKIDNVNVAVSLTDILGTVFDKDMLPDDIKNKLYSDYTSIIFVTFKSGASDEGTMNALQEMRDITSNGAISSMSAMVLDTMNLSNKEMVSYIVLAVIFCLIVLLVCTESYIVPVLLLFNIGIAILYNMGTNIFFKEISYITKAIASVLQLGVTTDFSIFLYHKYELHKKENKDKKLAMNVSIKETFTAVIASSLTTIIGFLSLCSMDLTLGADIGIVMAKGVIWGVISSLTLFPALLLVFDRLIVKTSHKRLLSNFNKLNDFVINKHFIILIFFVVLIIPAIISYRNVDVYYKLDKSLPSDMEFNIANKMLAEKFNIISPEIIILNKNIKNNDIDLLCEELRNVKGIDLVLNSSQIMESGVDGTLFSDDLKNIFDNDKYKLIVTNSIYEIASDELNAQIDEVNNIVLKYDKDAIVAGEGALMKDLVSIADHDFKMVNYISIVLIFIIMLFVLKSPILSVILILTIEFAIFTNMGISYYTGTSLPFISSIIVGTIQLGATIDYAILLSTKYLEERRYNKKFVAINNTLRNVSSSIITSALCFFAATFSVYIYTNIDMIGSICILLARGAIISMLVVTLVLPCLLIMFDKFIIKTTKEMKINEK